MKFEAEPTPEMVEEERILTQRWRNLEMCTPWTNNRPESMIVHNRAVDELMKDLNDC